MADANATMRRASGIVASGGLGALVVEYGIGGVFYAGFEIFISMLYSLGDTFLGPFIALYSGVSRFVDMTITSGLQIIEAGGQASASAVATGGWGVLAYAVAIASFILGLAVVVLFLRSGEWRPWNVITGR